VVTMASEMIERVARAIRDRSPTAGREPGSHMRTQALGVDVCRDLARAAIEAMREPAAEVVRRGMATTDEVDGDGVTSWAMTEAWQAMIDKALEP